MAHGPHDWLPTLEPQIICSSGPHGLHILGVAIRLTNGIHFPDEASPETHHARLNQGAEGVGAVDFDVPRHQLPP